MKKGFEHYSTVIINCIWFQLQGKFYSNAWLSSTIQYPQHRIEKCAIRGYESGLETNIFGPVWSRKT